jgi:hypothetical protein
MNPSFRSITPVSCALLFALCPRFAAAEDSFGTRPAYAPAPASEMARPQRHVESTDDARTSGDHTQDLYAQSPVRMRERSSPTPTNWAVLHAGLRPELGTFGGIATLALAQARTEEFYGGFSLALVRNDAGTHVGLTQIALGRSLADTFIGGVQLGLSENRARNFYGLAQVSIAVNRTQSFVGFAQMGAMNVSENFGGVFQLGGYNRAERFRGVLQIGAMNGSGSFSGIAQLGGFNKGDSFSGLLQVGVVNLQEKVWGIRAGVANVTLGEVHGLEVGALNTGYKVHGAQIGLVNHATEIHGVQIGLFNTATTLRGLQIGLVNHATDGLLPWTAVLNFGFGEDTDHDDDYEQDRSGPVRQSSRR